MMQETFCRNLRCGAGSLQVSEEEIRNLEARVEGMERSAHSPMPSYGRKMCPTRHGCQGATDCDYAYGSYPG